MRPQHAPGAAISTSHPAAVSTRSAARGMSGANASENESTHSTAFGPAVGGTGRRAARVRRNGTAGSSGSERLVSAPIVVIIARRMNGTRPIRFRAGPIGPTRRSHCGSLPNV